MELIHVLVRPYVRTIHNIFDGVVLQLITTLSVLSKAEFVDNYDKTLIVVVFYLLTILPLASFIVIKFWINRNKTQNIIKYCIIKCSPNKYTALPTAEIPDLPPNNEIGITIDDELRRNAYIVDM